MSLEYGHIQGSDWSEFRAFHNLLFQHTNASAQWFDWYMSRIGAHAFDETGQRPRVYTVRDSGKLIGTWCVEPKDFVMPADGRFIIVGRCFAVGIHPDYRRQNLFVELSNHAIAQERSLGRFQYILGFPQTGRPVIGGHLKAGWEPVQEIAVWDCRPDSNDTTSLHAVSALNDFQQVRVNYYGGGFLEDGKYRNLRWKDHPEHHYITLSKGSNYLVLKPYGSGCHLLDVAGNDREDVRTLIRAAKTLAYRHRWERMTAWCADNEFHRLDLEATGLAPTSESVTLLAVRIAAKEPLILNKCHLPMGVEEMY